MSKEYKCVTLKGELADFGNHVLLPYGITLCGLPTVDANKEQFPQLNHPNMADMINEYTEVGEWRITCEKCLEIFEMAKDATLSMNAKKN